MDTLLLRCKLCSGRETHPRLTPEEWLPCCAHHEAHRPTARSAEWGVDRVGVSDHPLHPWPSQSIRRVLSSLAINISLWQELVHPKDPIPEWQRKGVVYSAPCNECLRAFIRQTGRSLEHHIAEHWRAFRNGDTGRVCIYCWVHSGFI